MKFQSPPGVFDIVPQNEKEPWRNSPIWNHVEKHIRELCHLYGFHNIRTPLFEKTELFERSVGENTDIVAKEMYTFKDKGDRSLSLRPEGTAPVVRALLQNSLLNQGNIHKLYTIGPMFRYERSQAGRYRQHHQFSIEAIGIHAPEQDAELIDLAYTLCNRLGLKNLHVHINSLGDREDRTAYREKLVAYFKDCQNSLSEDSRKRLETNPLRILDSKALEDRALIENAPSMMDQLSQNAREHFEGLQSCLAQLEIPFTINERLVRGLDYYNRTVFEITSGELGAQNSVCGGGRYDGLIEQLGGPDLPAIGFGMGLERLIQTMIAQKVSIPGVDRPLLYLIPLGEEAKIACYALVKDLRHQGVAAQMDYTGRKLNKAMHDADRLGARFVAVIGEDEISSNTLTIKEMKTGETTSISTANLSRILQIEEESDKFIAMWIEMSKPFGSAGEAEFFLSRINRSIARTQKLTTDLQEAMQSIQSCFNVEGT